MENNTNNTLPAEVYGEIKQKAQEEYKSAKIEFSDTWALGFHDGYIAGATEYAQWKAKYNELECSHADYKEETELLRVKLEQAKKLLEKVVKMGWIPVDSPLRNDIKTFLEEPNWI
jgi:hypothetical protein